MILCAILFSMESPDYYPKLKKHGTYTGLATTSFESDIPVPYISQNIVDIQAPPVVYEESIRGASFIARNCNSKSHREEWVRKMMPLIRIDSLSSCMNNSPWPSWSIQRGPGGDWGNSKIEVMQKYLFHLAFENSIVDDYITEKLWFAFMSGTVPVYLGAPNIRDHVPSGSIIVVTDFESPEDLANYLLHLIKSPNEYDAYHAWRRVPLSQSFVDKYSFAETHHECRMCEFVLEHRKRSIGSID